MNELISKKWTYHTPDGNRFNTELDAEKHLIMIKMKEIVQELDNYGDNLIDGLIENADFIIQTLSHYNELWDIEQTEENDP